MSYTEEQNEALQCRLCPHNCRIPPAASGYCGVRVNRSGKLHLPYHGHITALALDPVEKKPLYHFKPGTAVLSLGFQGCNMACPFCQNHEISHPAGPLPGRHLSPPELIGIAKKEAISAVAFTYSEPLIHYEFLLECAAGLRRHGIPTILVTNGMLNRRPAQELLPFIDAVNVDLKSMNPRCYRETLKGDREAVLDFIRLAYDKTHLEVTTLIVPGLNDSAEEIRRAAGFLAELNPDIPYHLSAYRPGWRYSAPATAPALLAALSEAARESLRFVYTGNIPGESNTSCPGCGARLIRRQGYATVEENLQGKSCRVCGRVLNLFVE